MKSHFFFFSSLFITIIQCSKLISRGAKRCINTQLVKAHFPVQNKSFSNKALIGCVIGAATAAGYAGINHALETKKLNAADDIFRAIKTNNNDRFIKYINSGVDLNERDGNGVSVMEMIIKEGNHFQFAVLALMRVNIFDRDSKNRTYLETAIYRNQLLMASELIAFGLKISDEMVLKNLILSLCLNESEGEQKLDLIRELYTMSGRDEDIVAEVLRIAGTLDLSAEVIEFLNNLKNE